MKRILMTLFGVMCIAGCGDGQSIEQAQGQDVGLDMGQDEGEQGEDMAMDVEIDGVISFLGTWSRDFEAGPGNPHTATYEVGAEGIHYTLMGTVGSSDYVMARDAFVASENRYVGHSGGGQYYVLFVRDISESTITLYKQEVEGVAEGLGVAVPSREDAENHGWNIYQKQ